MLVIAHRRSTIVRADLTVTLSKGRVTSVETATGTQS
jgi:ABC-type transport system involved in Fe-S cluster assembly fused permease/ATPase subunit